MRKLRYELAQEDVGDAGLRYVHTPEKVLERLQNFAPARIVADALAIIPLP